MRLFVLLVLAGCGKSEIDRERAAQLFREVTLDTAPGLSGLAADDSGGIWTVSERRERAYRITLDAANTPSLEEIPIENTPDDFDLEGIAWLGGDRFAFGTEGKKGGIATVLSAERRGATIAITGAIDLPQDRLGIRMRANHGAEGVCGSRETVIAAIEGAGVADGKRFAPVVRIESGAIVRTHRVWLTTKTGKLSALDCSVAPDGTADVIAIERHFAETKILRFVVPPSAGDIVADVALDLGPVLRGQLNLEGIARMSDGRIVVVTDNHWKIIQGETRLLVFEPAAFR